MNDLNVIIVKGNLVHAPEVKFSPSGVAYCTVSIANNRQRKSGDDWKAEVHYFDVTVLGKQAENLGKYKGKGDPLDIVGRLEQRRWQDDSGKKHQRVVIVADMVHWLPRSDKSASRSPQSEIPGAVGQVFEGACEVGEGDIPF